MFLGYTRVSRVGSRAETLISPELQTERIRSYAGARGLNVEMLPPELDVSGGRIDRPVLDAAIGRIEAREASGIIVAQLDRLSRAGIVATHHLIERIESLGGKVIAVAESFDDSTPEGRMGRNVMLALGEMQLDRYRTGFVAAKESAVRRGIWPVPKPPRGYRVGIGRGLVPSGRGVVVRAFEARAAGASWSRVADVLGCSSTMARKTIGNRAYLGEIVLGSLRNPSAHEPIIERGLWEAAQVSHPAPLRRGRPRALLAGIIRCASCGFLMTPDEKRGWRGYRCHPRKSSGICGAPALISARLLDPFVEEVVLTYLRGLSVVVEPPQALYAATQALEAAEAELEAFQRAQQVSGLGEEHFLSGMRSRVEAVEEARRALGEARQVVTLPESALALDAWGTLSVAERNQVLRRSLSCVEVRRGKGDVLGRTRILDRDGAPIAVPEDLGQGLG